MQEGIEVRVEGNLMTIIRNDRTTTLDQRERRRNEIGEIALIYAALDLPGVKQSGDYRERLESAIDVVRKIINPPPPDRDSPEGRKLRIDAATKLDLNNADKVEEYRIEAWADHYAKTEDYEKSDAIWKTWSSQAGCFELADNTLVPTEGWPPNVTAEKYIRSEHVESDRLRYQVAPDDNDVVEPEPEPDDAPADPEPEPEPAPAPGETAALLEAALKTAS